VCWPARPSAGSPWKAPAQLHEVDFIFQVGPLSFVVALLAGAAGMLSLVSAKSAALVGVFISVTTVPAAGFAVVAATVGDLGRRSPIHLHSSRSTWLGSRSPGCWCCGCGSLPTAVNRQERSPV
jgi:hypothetical protein